MCLTMTCFGLKCVLFKFAGADNRGKVYILYFADDMMLFKKFMIFDYNGMKKQYESKLY